MPRVPPPGLPLAGISGDQRISCQLWDTQFWSNSSVIGQKGWWTKSLSYTHSIWYLIPFTASANVLPTLWYQLGRHRDPLLPSCTLYCCHHVCTFSLAYAFYILECHQRWSTVCLLGINMAHTGITAHVKINIYSFIRSAEYVCELFFFSFQCVCILKYNRCYDTLHCNDVQHDTHRGNNIHVPPMCEIKWKYAYQLL